MSSYLYSPGIFPESRVLKALGWGGMAGFSVWESQPHSLSYFVKKKEVWLLNEIRDTGWSNLPPTRNVLFLGFSFNPQICYL